MKEKLVDTVIPPAYTSGGVRISGVGFRFLGVGGGGRNHIIHILMK